MATSGKYHFTLSGKILCLAGVVVLTQDKCYNEPAERRKSRLGERFMNAETSLVFIKLTTMPKPLRK